MLASLRAQVRGLAAGDPNPNPSPNPNPNPNPILHQGVGGQRLHGAEASLPAVERTQVGAAVVGPVGLPLRGANPNPNPNPHRFRWSATVLRVTGRSATVRFNRAVTPRVVESSASVVPHTHYPSHYPCDGLSRLQAPGFATHL